MHSVLQDLRFAVRLFGKSRGFTAVALTTLALTIGANATIFSLVDALFLRPLPVPDSHEVVHVARTRTGRPDRYPLSYPDYLYVRDRAAAFSELAAHYPTSALHLVIDGDPRSVTGTVATASYFRVLQIQPAAGRFFANEEDTVPNRDAVAVISFDMWYDRLGRGRDAGAVCPHGADLRHRPRHPDASNGHHRHSQGRGVRRR